MKLHLPKGLRLALLGAIMSYTVAYGAEPVYENMTTGTSVSSGETVWAPSTEVEKVSYKNNTVSGYGNGVLEMELGSAGSKSLTITKLESVEFSGNTDTNTSGNDGGTIMMDSDGGENVLNINENTTVNFSQNTVSASGDYKNSYGAAIYMNGNCYAYITNNKDVTFKDNSVFSAAEENKYKGMTYGGAIYVTNSYISNADATLDVSNNTGTVLFEGNSVKTGNSHAYGGAICTSSDATLTLNGNNELIFRNNVAESTSANALGGAISSDGAYGASDGNIFEISGNTKVSFEGNAALGSPQNSTHKVQGGAIYTYKKGFAITGNESVSFTGNYVSAEEGTAEGYANVQGGAIYVRQGMKIQGNDNVLFAGNYEKTGSDYRMRSIYGTSDTGYYVSANKDGKVEFRDGFSLTALNRNGDHNLYLNSAYGDTAQTGTITMTGAYTEGMLEEIKGEGQVSDAEIAASQRFEVSGKTLMQGGTLEVVDSANYAGNGFEVAEEANATVRLRDSIFDHGSAEINFTSGSSLIVEGGATVNAGALTLASGSTLSVSAHVTEYVATNGIIAGTIASAAIDGTVNVSLTLDSAFLSSLDSEPEFSIKLLGASAATGKVEEGTLEYVDLDTSIWSGGTLTLDLRDNGLYVIGTLERNQFVEVEDGTNLDTSIKDSGEEDVRLDVTGEVTISGDNSHSGGTAFVDADVTLDSDSALGTGVVTNSGDTSLSTGTGVTVTLPDTIANSGKLSISGSYDGSSLDTIVVEDTRVNVSGEEGKNGFFRDGSTVITVVENGESGSLNVADGTTISKDGEELHLAASGKAGKLDYTNYHIEEDGHTASVSEIQSMSDNQTSTITMTEGTLVADGNAENVQATGGKVITKGDVTLGGKLTGDTKLVLGAGNIVLGGDNSHTSDTLISGSNVKLTIASDTALGKGKVLLDKHGKLDLNGKHVSNHINVTGCELHNASNFTGDLTVGANEGSTGELDICGTDPIARANKVTLEDVGKIKSTAGIGLEVNALEMASDATGTIDTALTINPGGRVILNNGSQLKVNGALTLGKGTTFVLKGNGYAAGSELGYGDPTADSITTGTATLANGRGTFTIEDGIIYLTAVFDNSIAEALTVTNWGIATASRSFVNTVRGQRSNTGCIANGRGTAWAAVLGGTSDIGAGDIDLKGAAVGADMKVGNRSRMGVAFGYIDGDAKIPGMSKAEQEGTYLALYGEHGLKKLSAKSCLSLDWVAAYGQTDTEWKSSDWEQQSLQFNTRLNWNKKVTNRLCMSVFGGLEYFASESDRVENAKSGSIQNLRGEIGVGARYVAWGAPALSDAKGGIIAPGCEKLVFNGELRYMNDMVRSNPVIEQDGLRGDGENPGRQGVGVEVGATYRIGERWSASANYSYSTMDDSREHRVNVGASYTF